MKQVVFLIAVLAMTAPVAQDWEGDLLGIKGDLHGSVGGGVGQQVPLARLRPLR